MYTAKQAYLNSLKTYAELSDEELEEDIAKIESMGACLPDDVELNEEDYRTVSGMHPMDAIFYLAGYAI